MATILPPARALMNAIAPKSRQGEATGLLSSAQMVGILLGPVLGTILASQVGYAPSFLVASIPLFLASVSARIVLPARRPTTPRISWRPPRAGWRHQRAAAAALRACRGPQSDQRRHHGDLEHLSAQAGRVVAGDRPLLHHLHHLRHPDGPAHAPRRPASLTGAGASGHRWRGWRCMPPSTSSAVWRSRRCGWCCSRRWRAFPPRSRVSR
ncbi:MAG: MFS transporter [Ktedonobacterales bacterium]